MIIIHGVTKKSKLFPRALTAPLRRALRESPVVVVTGARQTGKSTLIRELLGQPGRRYMTLDDLDTLERAREAPDELLAGRSPISLDEVQRAPELLLAVKRAVDQERRPGRFLLTGSANLALMQRVSESLAGRAVYLTVRPLTAGERAGRGRAGQWDAVLADPGRLEGVHARFVLDARTVLAGGLPPALVARSAAARSRWLDGYVRTYLERDLQTLSTIENLVDFRRLMRVAALRTAQLVNQTDMARDAGLSQPTAHRYLNLLEASYLFVRVPAFAMNRTKRLIKAPRLFPGDPGLAAHLAGVQTFADAARANLVGPLLEAQVLLDLQVWQDGRTPRPELLYWRTASGEEVDFVIEAAGRLVPVEVKATHRPVLADARHLRSFLEEYPEARHGVLLHTGTRAERLAPRVWALPLAAVLGLGAEGAAHSQP